MTIHMTPAERFLCCAVADDAQRHRAEVEALWRTAGDDDAWAVAARNDAASIAALALRTALGPTELPVRWREALHATESKIGLFLAQLDRVAEALAREGIAVVALKNSGIARGIFQDLAGCPMGDVDTLVDPRDFRRAHAVMLALGYTMDSRSPLEPQALAEAEAEGGSEYTLTLADGSIFWFELQWRPVSGRWIRPEREPAAADLLARSQACAGTAARLLASNDNLLQVCLHTAKHSYVRAPGFRLHTDVDRIVRRCPVDWDAFVRTVEAMHVCTAIYFSLALPAELLGTPVPATVLARLRPGAIKAGWMQRSIRRAGVFDPLVRKWSKPGYIVFNLLLYDDAGEALRAIFPDPDWICRRYGVKRRWTAPWWYLVRIVELLFKRANT